MTTTGRLNRRQGDILVPLARCEPLPPLWEWREALETSDVQHRFLEREEPFGIMNDREMLAALYAFQQRTGIEDDDAFPMPPGTPRPQVVLPEQGFSPDFFTASRWGLASRRLREILDQPPDVVEFTPIEILAGGEAARARDYHLMRVHPAQPAFDANLSDCEPEQLDHWLTGRPLLRLRRVKRIVLRADLRPRTDLFRVDEDPVTLLVTDALALRVLAAGLTGIEFRDPCGYAWGTYYKRLRTLDGVRLRSIGFDRWPPPPDVHVPILGWSPGDPPP